MLIALGVKGLTNRFMLLFQIKQIDGQRTKLLMLVN